MESETAPLVEKMTVKKTQSVHGRKVILGKLCGKKCAAVVCGVGKVNAAAGAQYAIDVLKADKIINIGVAGGLNDSTEVGKIYGISAAVQYDFDLCQLNGTTIGTLNEYSTAYLELLNVGLFEGRKLATADRFNDDKADFKLLTQTLQADIRDMEGGAIAQVCKHANVPFASFKAISDVAGNGSTTEQFKENLALCAKNMSGVIEKIFTAVNC
ncbi:MAG: 5'-methylthioadenosine/S-adenosylhomocysteine nucleosidase [Clostridia bacterium]|nr:5'-methylthioadenosine/S-adenosylhomocysteine nucleosidase [Clostridia bacterium]